MTKRPAFMFYPGDWLRNANLRRCSAAARGAWMDVMCLMHDSDEYGVLRWTLKEIARTLGLNVCLLEQLAEKNVMKGGDVLSFHSYIFRTSHAGKLGDPVVLVKADRGPCWYSSRMVEDEYKRGVRGGDTRFKSPSEASPTQRQGDKPNPLDGDSPNRRQGDGLAFAVAFAVPKNLKNDVGVNNSPAREDVRSSQRRFIKRVTSNPEPRLGMTQADQVAYCRQKVANQDAAKAKTEAAATTELAAVSDLPACSDDDPRLAQLTAEQRAALARVPESRQREAMLGIFIAPHRQPT
jgi:hypothetical protein